MKTQSTFFHKAFMDTLADHIDHSPHVRQLAESRKRDVSYWMDKSYEQLWALMFPPTIKRSWMVKSDGQCPDCHNDVHMYNWQTDPFTKPWKMTCPHCQSDFPKNNFYAYYQSGLGPDGIFDHALADELHLVNSEGGKFGVDDGFAYVDEKGDKYWFIGTYLIYGHWHQLILDGIVRLSDAYCLTNDPEYARRAAILLDRVADLYPDFDFTEQGIMYEQEKTSRGYITYWANAPSNACSLAISYDKIFPALQNDDELSSFLHEKAVTHGLTNQKEDLSQVRKNIEENILIDTLSHPRKIHTNYPNTEVTQILLSLILEDPDRKTKAMVLLDEMIEAATAVDGIAGEKGGYSGAAPNYLAGLFTMLDQTKEHSIASLVKKYPRIKETYRFHIDSWILNKYYPGHGDGGRLNNPTEQHAFFSGNAKSFSSFSKTRQAFAYDLYQCTGDPDFMKVLYLSNGSSSQGLFEDDFSISEPKKLQKELDILIKTDGPDPSNKSKDFQEFRMAILKSGQGAHRRALFLDYDSGGNHSHQDAGNIELYAKGMKFLPDFGYPPVNYGGWRGPHFRWYHLPSAHNLVVIDRKEHTMHNASGKSTFLKYPKYGQTTLWMIDPPIQAVTASAPEYPDVDRYERLMGLVDLDEQDAYFIDIFRVKGGREHVKFTRNGFSSLKAHGLSLQETSESYHEDALMRHFKKDAEAKPGWYADFHCEDLYEVLPMGMDLRLRYIPIQEPQTVYTSESIICKGYANDQRACNQETWIPTIMEMQSGKSPHESVFMSVYAPYENTIFITQCEKGIVEDEVPTSASHMHAAFRVKTNKGFTDTIIAKDPNSKGYVKAFHIRTNATLCFVRSFENPATKPIIRCNQGSVVQL